MADEHQRISINLDAEHRQALLPAKQHYEQTIGKPVPVAQFFQRLLVDYVERNDIQINK